MRLHFWEFSNWYLHSFRRLNSLLWNELELNIYFKYSKYRSFSPKNCTLHSNSLWIFLGIRPESHSTETGTHFQKGLPFIHFNRLANRPNMAFGIFSPSVCKTVQQRRLPNKQIQIVVFCRRPKFRNLRNFLENVMQPFLISFHFFFFLISECYGNNPITFFFALALETMRKLNYKLEKSII